MSHMLIDYYKAIEDSSAKMLEAAKLKDWDGVVRYEGACAVLIEQLRCGLSGGANNLGDIVLSKVIFNNDAIVYGLSISLRPLL